MVCLLIDIANQVSCIKYKMLNTFSMEYFWVNAEGGNYLICEKV